MRINTTSECSATVKRHQLAYQLLDELKASLMKANSVSSTTVDTPLQELSDQEDYVKQCVLLIRIYSLVQNRVDIPRTILVEMRRSLEVVYSITESYPMSSVSDMQLENVTVKAWVILLSSSLVILLISQSRCADLVVKVVQELRAQVENGALTSIDDQQLGISVTDLRSALSVIEIRAACDLYQNRDLCREQLIPLAVKSGFLLDTVEVLANDLVKFCPLNPLGYWRLGYVARESVAKRKWHGL